jgi:hypothetical protein
MKTARMVLALFAFLLVGCNSATKLSAPGTAVCSYNGTASVGDFVTISIDSSAQTITYKNYTNGETGTVSYAVNADGTYTITDPNGNLLSAYEVPGTVLIMEAAKAGPNRDAAALITAIESVPASITRLRDGTLTISSSGRRPGACWGRSRSTRKAMRSMRVTGPSACSTRRCSTAAPSRRRACRKTLREISSSCAIRAVPTTTYSDAERILRGGHGQWNHSWATQGGEEEF